MAEKPATVRLDWLDGMKGIAILWIVYFHAFMCLDVPGPLSTDDYFGEYSQRCELTGFWSELRCAFEALFVAVSRLGFHPVPVFLVLSGFGLAYSLAKTGEPTGGWIGWYKSRLLRLFPMYWLAHVIYLVVPFQVQYEPIDYRFVLSFFGDRVWPIDMIMFYFNPALWYFGLLLQLYLVFPVLFRLLQRLGPLWFLVFATIVTVACRYVLLRVWVVHGYYVEGGFFLPRSFGFMFGMTFGWLFRKDAATTGRWLFSTPVLLLGIASEGLALYSYAPLWTYAFNDLLISVGLTIIVAHVAHELGRVPAVGRALATMGAFSYGLYLLHQPFILYFAPKIAKLPMPDFVVLICGLIAILATLSMAIEKRMNALAQRVLG